MSIRIATNAALSGLLTAEARTSVSSANIANADVEGYSAKTAWAGTTVTGSTATGVTLVGISTYVDENLVKSIMSAGTSSAYAEVFSGYLDALSSSLGSPDDETNLSAKLTDLQTALNTLSVTPESDSDKYAAVQAAIAVADELNSLSDEVQSLRAQADQQIEDSVRELNEALESIDTLNEQITAYKALGKDTTTLEDERRVALETVASKMNISYFETSNGEMHVYTSTGIPLVDSMAHTVEYSALGTVTADTVSTDFDTFTVDGRTLTFSGGELGALVDLRDETLPTIQEELDELAVELMDELNAIHNQGTALPAAGTLTGTTSVTPTDPMTATGYMRIALVDEDGVVSDYVDLDLSTYGTYDDLATAIDSITGISASFDADGHLVVSSDNAALGVSINEMDSAVGADNEGVSAFFGLNDLFTGTSASDIRIRSDISSDYNLLSIATLSSDAALAVGDTGLAAGDGSIAEALESVLSSAVDFTAAGNLSGTSTTLSEYASNILSDVATQSSLATSSSETLTSVYEDLANTLSNESGVNLDEETALLTEMENLYSACAQVFDVVSQMFDSLLDAVR